MREIIESPFLRPVQMMAKPVGAACNLGCAYCYYRSAPGGAKGAVMSDELLERYIRDYIESSPQEDMMFIWHGGEPLLAGIPFFRRVLRLQRKYADGHRIDNSLQTNGTILTDEWCRLFRDHRFLLGVSIDGPAEWHDTYRTDRGGHPTHARVARGVDMLNRYGVEWNAMAVVNKLNVGHPVEFYRYFRDELGCAFLQFTPVFEDTPWSVTPGEWGEFLCGVYDEWVTHDVGRVFVQIFEAVLANRAGVTPGVCTLARECGCSPVVEMNGDVYMCDHFVDADHRLGNIAETPLRTLLNDGRMAAFGARKRELLPDQCRECRWLRQCGGECPKNGRRLCQGYKRFFAHSDPTMTLLIDRWRTGLPLQPLYSYK